MNDRKPVRSRKQAMVLFDEHLPLVPHFIKALLGRITFVNGTYDIDDVTNWSRAGLWDASLYWVANGGSTFRSYSAVRMRGTVLDQMRKLDPLTRTERKNISSDAVAFCNPLNIHGYVGTDEFDTFESVIPSNVDPYNAIRLSDNKRMLLHALRRLNNRERHIIYRHYFHDEHVYDISKDFGVTEVAIYKTMQKIREKLKQHLVGI